MDTRCLAWSVKDDIMGCFLGGPKYYLPFRCHETKLADQDICAKCLRKKELPLSNKNHPARWWGLVTEPIDNIKDQISHFAFSPWFVEWAKKKPLPPESMARAKKAIERAREGIQNPPPLPSVPILDIKETAVTPAPAPPAVLEKKKPRVVKKSSAVEEKSKETKETKPRKPRISKKTVATTVAPVVQAVLSEESPLEVEDVIEVEVKPFEHAGNLYYMDGKKSKLYDRQKDGGCKGIYMGRWDRELEKIIKDDDSDREV